MSLLAVHTSIRSVSSDTPSNAVWVIVMASGCCYPVCAPLLASGLDEVVVDRGFPALASFSVSRPRGVYHRSGPLQPSDGRSEHLRVCFIPLWVSTVGVCSGESKQSPGAGPRLPLFFAPVSCLAWPPFHLLLSVHRGNFFIGTGGIGVVWGNAPVEVPPPMVASLDCNSRNTEKNPAVHDVKWSVGIF
jgi:hypothetical protein